MIDPDFVKNFGLYKKAEYIAKQEYLSIPDVDTFLTNDRNVKKLLRYVHSRLINDGSDLAETYYYFQDINDTRYILWHHEDSMCNRDRTYYMPASALSMQAEEIVDHDLAINSAIKGDSLERITNIANEIKYILKAEDISIPPEVVVWYQGMVEQTRERIKNYKELENKRLVKVWG
jgi:hypothetical protein